MAKVELSEELQQAFQAIVTKFMTDERPIRDRQIRLWKKMEYYWAGFQRVWWDEVAHDWRVWNSEINQTQTLTEASFYDRPVNVFRAFLETIIAALSATVPGIKCIPDDADDMDDVATARGGDKIAELVYRHIDAELLWCKALFIYCTQGMAASYRYSHESDEYGEAEINEIETSDETEITKLCPSCGTLIGEPELAIATDIADATEDEFDPEGPVLINTEDLVTCPSCALTIKPRLEKQAFVVTRVVGKTKKPKSRQCVDVEGGLYVFLPNYIKNLKEAPLLGYFREYHYTKLLDMYEELIDKYDDGMAPKISASMTNDTYEQWGRLSTQYLGEYPLDTPTLQRWWIRPSTYNMIPDARLRKEAFKKFPNGLKITWVNEFIYVCAEDESLDDHWTITQNPLSSYIHFDPLGLLVTSVQEITSDLIALTMQTIEHGVPQTFADPKVLDFNQYRNSDVAPGSIYPAKPIAGKSIGDGFYSISTAQLGREVQPFGEKINELGQFVSGALPALFGGSGPANQRTAGQQQLSRNQALQRLQTPWKMINAWWEQTFGKIIPAYIKDMMEDERVVKEIHGTYINEMISRASLNGKIGSIQVDSSDQLPQTWAQIRDTIMQLIATNNPQILEALGSPDNLGILQEAVGLNGFKVPGEKDREKQYQEIKELLQSEPIEDGTGQLIPTVTPEFLVDNHYVEGEICRAWLVSDIGMETKKTNPGGYKNVIAHLGMHIQMMQQLQSGMQQDNEGPKGPMPGANKDAGRNFRTEQRLERGQNS